jgi:hypothetical protein
MDQRAASVYDFRDRNDWLAAHLSDSETQELLGEMVRVPAADGGSAP